MIRLLNIFVFFWGLSSVFSICLFQYSLKCKWSVSNTLAINIKKLWWMFLYIDVFRTFIAIYHVPVYSLCREQYYVVFLCIENIHCIYVPVYWEHYIMFCSCVIKTFIIFIVICWVFLCIHVCWDYSFVWNERWYKVYKSISSISDGEEF